ncbi:MAG: DUF1559 domain-containing protein [Planctomycetaceae bacterium]
MIVIIGLLMAMLLPAVGALREQSRRTQCVMNLSSLAFAVARHDVAKGAIPGWCNVLPSGRYSWCVPLLPYLERQDAYDALPSAAPYLSMFVCPSSVPDMKTTPLSYVGSAGAGSNVDGLQAATGVVLDTSAANGSVSLNNVEASDGTATTLLLSERCGRLISTSTSAGAVISISTWNAPATGLSWSGATPVFGMAQATAPGKVINSLITGGSTASGAYNMPNSKHPGGVVVAYCGGNVAFIPDTLAADLYAQRMSWRHARASGTTPYSTWVGSCNPE